MNIQIAKLILVGAIPLAFALGANAQERHILAGGVGVENISVERTAKDRMDITLDLDLSRLYLKSDKACLLTPVLTRGDKSLELPAVGLYSRGSFIQYLRGGRRTLSGNEKMTYSVKKAPRLVNYSTRVPWEDWMDGAELQIRSDRFGCRNCDEGSSLTEGLAGYTMPTFTFEPEFVYARPKAEVRKSRSISGEAFIDFVQGKTAVVETYHSNAAELAKIRAGVDSVRIDPDITLNGISLKGFASPEGPYALNERLAKGRTEAIRNYVRDIYRLDNKLFTTISVPENWVGLREYVAASDLPHKAEILAIIDDDTTFKNLDTKEWRIKSVYKDEYAVLLQDCYPYLRRTDYRIDYTIRSYVTAEELEEIFATRPRNLSLEEFYLLASKYRPGEDKFNAIFLEAVKTYPDDPVANLNAAMAKMQEGDHDNALDYLGKTGDDGAALYAQGLFLALVEDYTGAEDYFTKARDAGIPQAAAALDQLRKRKEILFLW